MVRSRRPRWIALVLLGALILAALELRVVLRRSPRPQPTDGGAISLEVQMRAAALWLLAAFAPDAGEASQLAPSEDAGSSRVECSPPCPVDRTCDEGVCQLSVCGTAPPNTFCLPADGGEGTCCEGRCLQREELERDPRACGECGWVCPPGLVCRESACRLPDGGAVSECDGLTCAEGRSCRMEMFVESGENERSHSSGFGPTCLNSACTATADGTVCVGTDGEGACCAGHCLPGGLAPGDCGKCGVSCRPNEACLAGECVQRATCTLDAGPATPCAMPDGDGGFCCGERCVDSQTDSQNCGACGKRCATGQVCRNLQCVRLDCQQASSVVDGCVFGDQAVGVCCRGACLAHDAFDRDPTNCGGCGLVCAPGLECLYGRCADPDSGASSRCEDAGCAPGWACVEHGCVASRCSGDVDGLECAAAEGQVGSCCGIDCVNVRTDSRNCGRCRVRCQTPEACLDGVCGATPLE